MDKLKLLLITFPAGFLHLFLAWFLFDNNILNELYSLLFFVSSVLCFTYPFSVQIEKFINNLDFKILKFDKII